MRAKGALDLILEGERLGAAAGAVGGGGVDRLVLLGGVVLRLRAGAASLEQLALEQRAGQRRRPRGLRGRELIALRLSGALERVAVEFLVRHGRAPE